jgi:dTDP-4-dehydrorhamnose reductase
MVQLLRERFADVRCTIRGRVAESAVLARVPFLGSGVYEGVDVNDWPSLEALLAREQPPVLINCTGVIKQRAEAQDPVASIAVNALLPHRLAAVAAVWGGRVIHFSTDCVFSGRKGNYREDDPCDAEDVYGRSKWLGELTAPHTVTFRTSIIGRELRHGTGLLEWFLSRQGERIGGYRRAIYSGVTTNHLANLTADTIRDRPALAGLYQVAAAPISKYELLLLLRDAFGLAVDIGPDDSVACDRSLDGGRFHAATGYVAPPWPELVAELANDPTPYQDWK